MNQLLAFNELHGSAIRTDEALKKSAARLCMSEDDAKALADVYLDVVQNRGGNTYDRSAAKSGLLLHTFLAGALWTETWSLSTGLCSDLAKDLRIYADAVWTHLMRMGCAKKNQQDAAGARYEIVIPLKAEVAAMRQRRKVQKQW